MSVNSIKQPTVCSKIIFKFAGRNVDVKLLSVSDCDAVIDHVIDMLFFYLAFVVPLPLQFDFKLGIK